MHLDIRRSRRVKVRKRIEWHSTHFPPSPPLSHVSPKLSQLPLTGEVINFIYTLIRLLDLSLSLLEVGVKGLWGSSQELMLRFSHLIASRLGKRSRQDSLEAVPSL